MATENLSIKIDEKGALVVSRNINDIGKSAKQTGGAIQLLKRALGLLAGAAVIKQLIGLADAFTIVQNKLRQVTTGTENLAAVTDELFAISARTRSSFEATAEGYAKIALAAKDLGQTQSELLQFTESLNKAVVVGGSSSTEAAGGLRQLSQGLASGALRGDELISVLENLPFVADVIAKQLKVTRGELRQMGAQGKITAIDVIDAFKNQREEIEGRFARTIPTVSEAVLRLTDSFTVLIGKFNTSKGITAGLAQGLIKVADSIEVVGQFTDTLTVSVIALGSAIGIVKINTLLTGLTATKTVMAGLISVVGTLKNGVLALVTSMGPLAIALTAIGAAAVLTTFYFDALEKEQQKIFDIEQKTHDARLARFRLQLQEIKNRKTAESDLKKFLVVLREETRVTSLSKDAKRQETAELKASQAAKRDLLPEEKEEIATILATTKAREQERAMLQSILGPQQALTEALATLERIKPELTIDQYTAALARLREEVTATDPVAKFVADLKAETEALGENSRERELRNKLRSLEEDKGSELTTDEIADVTTAVGANQQLTDEQALYEQIIGPQTRYAETLSQLNSLKESGRINQAQFNAELQNLGGYDARIAALQEEQNLLRMTDEEQIKYLNTKELIAEAQLRGETLTEGQLAVFQATIDQTLALEDQKDALDQVLAPQRQYERAMAALNEIMPTLTEEQREFAEVMRNDVQSAYDAAKPPTELESLMAAPFNSALDALTNFATNGKLVFGDFVADILTQIARLAAQKLFTSGFGSLGLPGFATGGQFAVGGQGGVDSQTVAFRATPGEVVTVTPPGASAPAATAAAAAPAGANIKIVNVIDPNEVTAALQTEEGEEAILNVISRNPTVIRQAIS